VKCVAGLCLNCFDNARQVATLFDEDGISIRPMNSPSVVRIPPARNHLAEPVFASPACACGVGLASAAPNDLRNASAGS